MLKGLSAIPGDSSNRKFFLIADEDGNLLANRLLTEADSNSSTPACLTAPATVVVGNSSGVASSIADGAFLQKQYPTILRPRLWRK
jgi:hypothetical protein